MLQFYVDKVYLNVGRVEKSLTFANQFRPARPWDRLERFGVLLSWPKEWAWLQVKAEAAPDPPNGKTTVAFQTGTALDPVCAVHEVRRDFVAPPAFLQSKAFLVASLPRLNQVTVTVILDTDNDHFRQLARQKRDNDRRELVLPLEILFFDNKQFPNPTQPVSQRSSLQLILQPCEPLPHFDGLLAIDLGNTSTTAVSLHSTDPIYQISSLRELRLETQPQQQGTTAMPSVVRIDRIISSGSVPAGIRSFPSLPGDDRLDAIQFVTGEWATAGLAGRELPPGVVFGAKQLLAAKGHGSGSKGEPYIPLTVLHYRVAAHAEQLERVEILKRLPGELLFTHVLRRFMQDMAAWPSDIVLTYPTTYGPRELLQLIRAAARGWLRALSQPQSYQDGHQPGEDAHLEALADQVRQWLQGQDSSMQGLENCPLVGMTLDEATAAAFFHVYRMVFDKAGGLDRFRYLYPYGAHLLIVDCGGGTTDIALAHVAAPPEPNNLLVLDMLARTGVRGFGGDHITRQVARLLKAALIPVVARAAQPGRAISGLPPLPQTANASEARTQAAVEQYIQAASQLDPTDQLVPTRFDPNHSDPAQTIRRTAAYTLWQLAERVKRRLAEGKPVKLREVGAELLGRDSSALVASILRPLPAAVHNQLLNQIGEITIAPWQVDALICPTLKTVVDKCNRLIRKHLLADTTQDHDREIDVIVLSGNGARYPLIGQLLREQLAVAEADARMVVDDQNRKDAVAKGAALARMFTHRPQSVGIRFNRHLAGLLPFDVGYYNLRTNQHDTLFREYTPYPELAKQVQRVHLAVPGGDSSVAGTFILERRFPGDERFSPFASYQFQQGIKGQLEIGYDPATGEFWVKDTTTGEVGTSRDLTGAEELAPVLRGDI